MLGRAPVRATGKKTAYTYLQMEPNSLGPELQPIWPHLHRSPWEGNTERKSRERFRVLGCVRGWGIFIFEILQRYVFYLNSVPVIIHDSAMCQDLVRIHLLNLCVCVCECMRVEGVRGVNIRTQLDSLSRLPRQGWHLKQLANNHVLYIWH